MKKDKNPRMFNFVLWSVQSLLAFIFLLSGFLKVKEPMKELAVMMPWTAEISSDVVRLVGYFEILGAIGLILPSVLRIKPGLTPLAARGLALIMFFATFFHISRNAFLSIPLTIVLGLLAVFTNWGRSKKLPISKKNSGSTDLRIFS
jgi:putative oxidoreductase